MALDPKSRARFNLSKTVVLVFDPTPLGLAIVSQILSGFGARKIHRCGTIEEAKQVVADFEVDLMIIDAMAESGEGYEFVRWLRANVPEPNRHTPVLLTAAHTEGLRRRQRPRLRQPLHRRQAARADRGAGADHLDRQGRPRLRALRQVRRPRPPVRQERRGRRPSAPPPRGPDSAPGRGRGRNAGSEAAAGPVPFIDRPLKAA